MDGFVDFYTLCTFVFRVVDGTEASDGTETGNSSAFSFTSGFQNSSANTNTSKTGTCLREESV